MYEGLETFGLRGAHKRSHKDAAIELQVIGLRQANPDWGKARISQEMAKANNGVAVVSPNTVRRMPQGAGLWPESTLEKKNLPETARTAEQSDQALNIDLCFVPEEHIAQDKLPAVSGSSEHLVIEHCMTGRVRSN